MPNPPFETGLSHWHEWKWSTTRNNPSLASGLSCHILINSSLVHSSVEFMQCSPVNQEAYCPFSSSSRAKTTSALSQSTERHSRDGGKNRKTQRYRDTGRKHTDNPEKNPWLQLSVWGIMWGRWSMILIRSLFVFLIITSMCCRSAACFVYSCEWEKTADLLTFSKMSTGSKL